MRIDVKKYLDIKEAPERLFIKRQGPDKKAAAKWMPLPSPYKGGDDK